MEIIDVKELARRLGVPVSQAYRQVELGHWPVIKAGRYHRFAWPKILEILSDSGYIFEREEEEADGKK